MGDAAWLVLAAVAGLGLGVFYFGGLWLTLSRLPRSRHPALLAMGSFLLRTAGTLVAFYFVMGGRWERLVACLAGMIVVRTVLVRRIGPVE